MHDKELVVIHTETFDFFIKGQGRDDNAFINEDLNEKSTFKVSSYKNHKIKEIKYDGEAILLNEKVKPLFFEENNYQIVISENSKNTSDLDFYHENENIEKQVTKISSEKNVLTGVVNFRSNIGLSELVIRGNGEKLLSVVIEVFPTKIEYQEDYKNLLNSVNDIVYNLAYNYLKRTFQQMKVVEKSNVSYAEFFTILNEIFDQFIKAFKRIEENPHHKLRKIKKVKPAARVKKISKKSIKWINKNNQFYDRENNMPTRLIDVEKRITYDTFENRFLKWIILETIKRIKQFIHNYREVKSIDIDNSVNNQVILEAEKMIQKLNFYVKHSFLKNVGELYKLSSITLVLQMAPGYRDIYKYYLVLKKGLSIDGELYRLSMKDTWQLYEYWCFLKLNDILKNKYRLVKHDLIDVNYTGIFVTLNTSSRSVITYLNENTGEKFKLHYNQSEGDYITTKQRPDNVLTLYKEGQKNPYKFIFDAKYRIYNDNGVIGPPNSTINAMHRYRDAIVSEDESIINNTSVGAYVLFPYHDEEKFKEHKFYKSIAKVNIGAFPLLPGSDTLLTDFLHNIVEESPHRTFKRNILPRNINNYYEEKPFSKNVLVGSLKSRKQFEFVIKNKFYYMPYAKSVINNPLKYIALYQSKYIARNNGVEWFGEISDFEIVKRNRIPFKLPHKTPEKLYIKFNIKKWQRLRSVIVPNHWGVYKSHMYTSKVLLDDAKTISELCIDNKEEWLLWKEIMRYSTNETEVIKNISDIFYVFRKLNINISKTHMTIKKDNKILKKISIKDFNNNPRHIFKEIIELST